MKAYKPANYNSLSPYLIVDNAQKLMDLLKVIFNATELFKYCTTGLVNMFENALETFLSILNVKYDVVESIDFETSSIPSTSIILKLKCTSNRRCNRFTFIL